MAQGRPLSRDVASWAAGELVSHLDAEERRGERNRLLLEAAAQLPAGTWRRAKLLYAEVRTLQRALPTSTDNSPRGLVAAALQLTPGKPPSFVTVYRVLKAGEKS